MRDSDILLRLTAIFADLIGRDDLTIDPATRLDDLPDWDSIKFIEAIAVTEEEFDISVPLTQIDTIYTVADLIRVVRGQFA